jgi:hypothetical protein
LVLCANYNYEIVFNFASRARVRTCLGLGAAGEEIVALVANLLLDELLALTERLAHVAGGGLDRRAGGTAGALNVLGGDSACAEQAPVREILCGQVTDWELGKDDGRASLHARVEFVVDDAPLSVDNGLVLLGVSDADLQGRRTKNETPPTQKSIESHLHYRLERRRHTSAFSFSDFNSNSTFKHRILGFANFCGRRTHG